MRPDCHTPSQDAASNRSFDPDETWKTVCLHRSEEVVPFLEGLLVELVEQGYSPRDCAAVQLALDEAVINGLRHGNGEDPTKCVWVCYRVDPCCMLVEVADEGPGFDPNLVPDPTLPENQERPCGRGVFLMRHFMTWVRFSARGNRVLMCKHPSA